MRSYLLSDVDMGAEEVEAVTEVVRSKWLSAGPKTAAFEAAFAEALGAAHGVALSSCTAALHLALDALEVGPGDEVLLPSYTFVATANAVLYQRATPVFVDIVGPHDLNLDPADLAAKVTPRTKAIVAVHLAGFPADMDALMAVAERYGLAVIEDACHAVGADYRSPSHSALHGRKAGTIGHIGCFSFFANKNLVTGEGGMAVTDDESLARKMQRGRSHGMTKSSWDKASGRASDYDVVQLGYNYRPTEVAAALGLVQLRKLAGANERRRELAAAYRRELLGLPGLTMPFAHRLDGAHHILPILLDEPAERPGFRHALKEAGVQTSVHYPPAHRFSQYWAEYGRHAEVPRTDDVAAREVTLPLHPLLGDEDVAAIAALTRQALVAEALPV
ncbi:MAG: aminotransferase class I/II-fold pyridoxal phosphate-dependent enzyme [Acidobacteria bacterium]|nr:aminotransferase class I/II-fold pyridoxal phosphate-dependent enzyme [Acidobacteriota bacterium]